MVNKQLAVGLAELEQPSCALFALQGVGLPFVLASSKQNIISQITCSFERGRTVVSDINCTLHAFVYVGITGQFPTLPSPPPSADHPLISPWSAINQGVR